MNRRSALRITEGEARELLFQPLLLSGIGGRFEAMREFEELPCLPIACVQAAFDEVDHDATRTRPPLLRERLYTPRDSRWQTQTSANGATSGWHGVKLLQGDQILRLRPEPSLRARVPVDLAVAFV